MASKQELLAWEHMPDVTAKKMLEIWSRGSSLVNVPHMCVMGPEGSGKLTLLRAWLNKLAQQCPIAFSIRPIDLNKTFPLLDDSSESTARGWTARSNHHPRTTEDEDLHSQSVAIPCVMSNVHVELDARMLHASLDAEAIQRVLKRWNFRDLPLGVMFCVLHHAEHLSPAAQACLRRYMEEYRLARFVFIVRDRSALLPPLCSRAIPLRVERPSRQWLQQRFSYDCAPLLGVSHPEAVQVCAYAQKTPSLLNTASLREIAVHQHHHKRMHAVRKASDFPRHYRQDKRDLCSILPTRALRHLVRIVSLSPHGLTAADLLHHRGLFRLVTTHPFAPIRWEDIVSTVFLHCLCSKQVLLKSPVRALPSALWAHMWSECGERSLRCQGKSESNLLHWEACWVSLLHHMRAVPSQPRSETKVGRSSASTNTRTKQRRPPRSRKRASTSLLRSPRNTLSRRRTLNNNMNMKK